MVEDGYVMRAVKLDHNRSRVSASVYHWGDGYGWCNVNGRRALSTVRKGLANGTYKVM